MTDFKGSIDTLIEDLKRERDELKVQVHLAKMEASDDWVELEAKLEKLESHAKELGGAAAEASKEIGAAAKLLGEEILKGFKSIAKKL